jgi:hypothetical protein
MTTIKAFNKATCTQFRNELNAVLAKFGQETGLMLSIGNIRFAPDGSTLHTRLDAHVKAKMSSESVSLGQTPALMKVLKREGLGDTFLSPTQGEITLIDYRARSHKFPFIGRRKDGKMFKFPLSSVVAGQEKKLAARR